MKRIRAMGMAALITGMLPLATEAGAPGSITDVQRQAAEGITEPNGSDADGEKASEVRQRPCSDFLSAQGTLHRPPQYLPPVRDYVGWTDNPFETFGLVDYAGLADRFITRKTGRSLGTEVRCVVTERARSDGGVQIRVNSFTSNALGFAQSKADLAANHFNLRKTPTNFGAKAQAVVEGAEPAVGPALLDLSFRIDRAGGPLPDLLAIVDAPCDYAPVSLRFGSYILGKVPDGTDAVLMVREAAALSNQACARDPQSDLKFSEEVVDILLHD